jgi:hypothetical protein
VLDLPDLPAKGVVALSRDRHRRERADISPVYFLPGLVHEIEHRPDYMVIRYK